MSAEEFCKTATERAKCLTDLLESQFNRFDRNIDRKYALYSVFQAVRPEFGFKVEKMVGSNQVLLYDKGKLVYDSEREGKLSSPTNFKQFLKSQIQTLVERGKP